MPRGGGRECRSPFAMMLAAEDRMIRLRALSERDPSGPLYAHMPLGPAPSFPLVGMGAERAPREKAECMLPTMLHGGQLWAVG